VGHCTAAWLSHDGHQQTVSCIYCNSPAAGGWWVAPVLLPPTSGIQMWDASASVVIHGHGNVTMDG
jgi:hypothetical protein